jgi:hypothetical protein
MPCCLCIYLWVCTLYCIEPSPKRALAAACVVTQPLQTKVQKWAIWVDITESISDSVCRVFGSLLHKFYQNNFLLAQLTPFDTA